MRVSTRARSASTRRPTWNARRDLAGRVQGMTGTIAFQGEPGANSHLACQAAYPEHEPLPCALVRGRLRRGRDGRADLAMIPIDNSLAGPGRRHPPLPARLGPAHHRRALPRAIQFTLLGVPGATLDDDPDRAQPRARARPVPQGDPRARPHAGGLRRHRRRRPRGRASRRPDPGRDRPPLAAEIYGLEVLRDDVEDEDHNTTRFVCLSREPRRRRRAGDGPVVTSFVFNVRNLPAALYKALGGFATNGVNMTKLESYMVGGEFTATQFLRRGRRAPRRPAGCSGRWRSWRSSPPRSGCWASTRPSRSVWRRADRTLLAVLLRGGGPCRRPVPRAFRQSPSPAPTCAGFRRSRRPAATPRDRALRHALNGGRFVDAVRQPPDHVQPAWRRRSVDASGAWRAIAASSAARRRAYSVRMRRICGASRPWRMNSARVAWFSVSMPRSISVPQPHERRHQRRGNHRKTQAQRRRQRLAERAAVDHPPGAIERGQRRQRMAGPAELRIAVVLQHPGVGAAGPVEQRQAAADRQRTAQRRGMGRRHQRQARVGRALDAGGDIEPSASLGTGTGAAPAASSAPRPAM